MANRLQDQLTKLLDEAIKAGQLPPAQLKAFARTVRKIGGGEITAEGLDWAEKRIAEMPVLVNMAETRPPQDPETPPTPDWSKWGLMLEATIREAVALSCNIAPEAFRHGISGDSLDEFFRREDVTKNYVQSQKLATLIRDTPYGARNDFVSLEAFAKFARRMKWSLPPEFPSRPPGEPLEEPTRVLQDQKRWPWGDYETPHLQAFAEAGREFFSKPHARGDEPKSDSVADWLEKRGVPKAMAAVMARIFRDPKTPAGPRR